MISPGRLLYLLRRDLKRGFGSSYHFYKTLPRIEEWSWPYWSEDPSPVPVHILTGRDHWQLAAWMLASWFHFSEQGWQIVIHDDGTLPEHGRASLQAMFPKTRVITRAEADSVMNRKLLAYPYCLEYREMHPLALKVFDIPHFASAPRFIVFDSDLLFFNHPREIIDWAKAERNIECWFNEDVQESSLLSAAEVREEFGVKLWPRVNSGLALIYKSAMDLDVCDRALAETSIMRGHVWRIEQTLFALCASRHGRGGLLPKRYEVSLGRHSAPDAVSRHYVGAVRDRFYGEGLRRLETTLLAGDEEAA